MRMLTAAVLLLSCAACSEQDAPAEQIAEQAQEVVDPKPEAKALAKGPWAPRDECSAVEGAAEFRQRLAEAVRLRDADTLVALAADDVMLDFGGGAGSAELRKRLYDPQYKLWEELDALLQLGCAANDEGGITLPWVWAQDLGIDDPFSTLLVTGEDVPIKTAPNARADQLDTVSWDLVEAVSFDPARPFQEIKVADGGSGFIATDKLRSVIDYRLIASSRNGKWSITSFIAGD